MFLISLTLTATADQIEPHNKAHGEWVRHYITEGKFLLAGQKKNSSGGVLLATGLDAVELARVLGEDSYVMASLGSYEVTECAIKLTQPWLEGLKAA